MFKLFIGFLAVIFILISPALAQQMQDMIYLKNGSIIRGKVIAVSEESISIRTKDGSVLIYKLEEIARITWDKERLAGYQNVSMRGEKSPGVAFLLSFLVPGVGQYYNGDIVKGVIQEALVLGGITIALVAGKHEYSELDYYRYVYYGDYIYNYYEETTAWFWIGLGVAGASSIWSMIDAPISASRINREREGGYGHLLEFNSDKQVIGIDFSTNGKTIGAKLSMHF